MNIHSVFSMFLKKCTLSKENRILSKKFASGKKPHEQPNVFVKHNVLGDSVILIMVKVTRCSTMMSSENA